MILVRRLLGDVLRGRRQRSGRTLRQLAATARVSPGYLSEVERGQKEPSSELLAAICDALEVKLSDVLLELSTELAAAELAAEIEAAELGSLVPADRRTPQRVAMPPARSGQADAARQGQSQAGSGQRSGVVVGVGAGAPRGTRTIPTAKIPTAVINSRTAGNRPGNTRPASGSPRVAPKSGAVPQATRGTGMGAQGSSLATGLGQALGPQPPMGPLPYVPGSPLPGPENPYTFGTPRLPSPTGRS
ncbi:transcriptional regulator, XRE family [Catenulispora acidiphila DSM 44928]|uniref:Transcriptional regulator, XRE family n=1 Tax=Catenulispora acidiphila (strain DSM 44928 / JCM 14897 / NBRC 102108 / NRRL B-24433 / ID139908) TaxID=479433 RepID=C7Q5E2_CATAD|nr:helix-turn-helix transcriptional regulator [Catenulispora acidiphila]ACU75911.1 transcriptional regulator, XRE family [Catenulispora acidiphila DSM 44928]